MTSDEVILQHLSPFRFYAGFLRFKGAFSEDRGSVNLEGKFEINNPFLMNVWFIVSVFFFILLYIFHTSEVASLSLLTFSVLMLIIWLFLIFIGYRRGKIDDIDKISSTIIDSLS